MTVKELSKQATSKKDNNQKSKSSKNQKKAQFTKPKIQLSELDELGSIPLLQ